MRKNSLPPLDLSFFIEGFPDPKRADEPFEEENVVDAINLGTADELPDVDWDDEKCVDRALGCTPDCCLFALTPSSTICSDCDRSTYPVVKAKPNVVRSPSSCKLSSRSSTPRSRFVCRLCGCLIGDASSHKSIAVAAFAAFDAPNIGAIVLLLLLIGLLLLMDVDEEGGWIAGAEGAVDKSTTVLGGTS